MKDRFYVKLKSFVILPTNVFREWIPVWKKGNIYIFKKSEIKKILNIFILRQEVK